MPLMGFVLSMRVTLLGAEQTRPRPIFQSVFGIEPTSENSDTRALTYAASAEDASHRWSFSVSCQVDRVDVLQQALVDPGADTSSFTRLRPVSDVLQSFITRVSAASALPWASATRLAVGSVIRWNVPDPAAANRALIRRFPGLPVGDDDQDVIFRRNHPMNLEGTSLRCNRIETWQAARSIAVVVGPTPRVIANRNIVLLETDVNTDQDSREPLTPESGPRLATSLLDATIAMIPTEMTP